MAEAMAERIRRWIVRPKTGWRLTWTARAVLLGSVMALGLAARGPLLAAAYDYLSPSAPLVRAKALVVEGWVFDSGKRLAVDLYRRGYGDIVFTTGTAILQNAACFPDGTWAEATRKQLVALGIPADRVIAVPAAVRGTQRSAEGLRPVLQRYRADSIILVTQKGHLRRSLLAFRKALRDAGVTVQATSAEEEWFRSDNWWTTHDGLIALAVEYMALGYYWWKGYV
jgi:uncharacterized SAM-binding protein YcdF (DUF218 family)